MNLLLHIRLLCFLMGCFLVLPSSCLGMVKALVPTTELIQKLLKDLDKSVEAKKAAVDSSHKYKGFKCHIAECTESGKAKTDLLWHLLSKHEDLFPVPKEYKKVEIVDIVSVLYNSLMEKPTTTLIQKLLETLDKSIKAKKAALNSGDKYKGFKCCIAECQKATPGRKHLLRHLLSDHKDQLSTPDENEPPQLNIMPNDGSEKNLQDLFSKIFERDCKEFYRITN